MTERPAPISVPLDAAGRTVRAEVVRGPRERDGRWYWRATRGGARGEDVSADVLRAGRWLSPEHAARAVREAAERSRAPRRRTVAELLAKYEAHVEATARSAHTVTFVVQAVRRLDLDALAQAELSTLTRDALQAARDRMLQTYASHTVARDLKVLATAWRWADSEGVSLPPWPGVRVTVYETRAKPTARDAEVEAIAADLAALDDWRIVAYWILVETGARRSEVMSLRLEDVDLSTGHVRVRGKLTKRAGPSATRTIPLPADGDALPALRRWCRDRLPGPLWPRPSGSALDHAVRDAALRAGVRVMAPGAWRRRADGQLIGAGKFAELPAIMDHSLVRALADYNRPEGEAVKSASSVLRTARHSRDTADLKLAGNARK